jgi:thioredoxin 1
MNLWMENARQRSEFVCLAILAGTVLFSGCSFNRSSNGGFLSWMRVSQSTDSTSIVQRPASIASSSAVPQSDSAGTEIYPRGANTAYPPIQFVSETSATPPPQTASQPLASTLGGAKIEPRRLPIPERRAVIHANEATFEQEVLRSDEPVLVDFYANWCGPCKKLAPTLEEVAIESPQARVVKVNIDENPELAAQYSVKSLPSLLVFKDGKVVSRQNGLVNKARLHSMLDL